MFDRLAPLYRALMAAQNRGTCTEHNLLDSVVHWWYDGEVGENYSQYYVRKEARGADNAYHRMWKD